MLPALLFGAFFALALAGVPLLFSLLATTVGAIAIGGLGHPLETIFLSFIGGVEPFILIAVPLFIFAGEILSSGGIGRRIVDFARALLGFLPGGLGIVTIASCLMFGAALLAVAGTLALLMPLSIPFLVYAFISGVSMRQLSMSGLVPGLVMAFALMLVCVWYGRKTGCDNGEARASARQIWAATKDAGPALLMPLIIVGGIWSGVFTPTESAAVAVVYGIVVSLFFYKDIGVRDLPRLLVNAFQTSATVMLVIGATGALAWLITVEQVAVQLAAWIRVVADQPWIFLLLVNVALLLLGIFIEPLPAMLLTAPLLLPIAQKFGIDLVHLGVVITANLAIALYTPPVGGTLFVAAKLAGAGIGEITKALWPLLIAAVVVLFGVTYVPWTTSVIWRMVN